MSAVSFTARIISTNHHRKAKESTSTSVIEQLDNEPTTDILIYVKKL
jgi:hypothetical protein